MRPWLRTLLFCTPPALLVGLPALALWLGGELTAPETILERQLTARETLLHGPALTNPIIYLKTRAIPRVRPRVLALGTSRVLQFRRGFFLPGVSFYNGGSCIQRIQHLRQLVGALPPEQPPEVLIVGLEQAWFNPRSSYTEQTRQGPAWFSAQASRTSSPLEILRADFWTVHQQLWRGKITPGVLASGRGWRDRVGFAALMRDRGMRRDGSFAYSELQHDVSDPRHPDHDFVPEGLHRIRDGIIPFEPGDSLSEASLRELEAFLRLCQKREIAVVAFLPPYPHLIWQTMQDAAPRFAYQAQVEPAVRPLLARYGAEFYNFSDMATLGAGDHEALDSFHGSEKVYVRLLIRMLEEGSRLNEFASLPVLRAALAHATSHHDLLPEPEP